MSMTEYITTTYQLSTLPTGSFFVDQQASYGFLGEGGFIYPTVGSKCVWMTASEVVAEADRNGTLPLMVLHHPAEEAESGPSYWLASHGDMSAFRVFDSEIECLRYAVEHSMSVSEVQFGADPTGREQ